MEFEKIIHLEEAGTLKNFISRSEQNSIFSLKITGFINKKDIDDVLDDMCTSEGEYDDDGDNRRGRGKVPFGNAFDEHAHPHVLEQQRERHRARQKRNAGVVADGRAAREHAEQRHLRARERRAEPHAACKRIAQAHDLKVFT